MLKAPNKSVPPCYFIFYDGIQSNKIAVDYTAFRCWLPPQTMMPFQAALSFLKAA
jgi:hypothetical protein